MQIKNGVLAPTPLIHIHVVSKRQGIGTQKKTYIHIDKPVTQTLRDDGVEVILRAKNNVQPHTHMNRYHLHIRVYHQRHFFQQWIALV